MSTVQVLVALVLSALAIYSAARIFRQWREWKRKSRLEESFPAAIAYGEPKEGWGPIMTLRRHQGGWRRVQVTSNGYKGKMAVFDIDSRTTFLRSSETIGRLVLPA